MTNNDFQNPTLDVVNALAADGVRRMVAIVRHGARLYDPVHTENEPFMPLSDEGKQQAYAFGLGLPKGFGYRFSSSAVGRCIETAYQIEKGCIARGAQTVVNAVVPCLAPFFIVDRLTVFARCAQVGADVLFGAWLNGEIAEDILERPEVAVRGQIEPLVAMLRELDGPAIAIAVSHDCNIYLLRHQCLNERHDPIPPIAYLEGVVLFERNGAIYITAPHTGPMPL